MLPVCYGDALFGMWKGFEELKALGWIDRMPRFVAAEVSGSLTAAMASGDAMPPESAAQRAFDRDLDRRGQGTVQALDVLRRSKGAAVTVERRRYRALGGDARAPGKASGPRPSSAAPFAAIERLRADGTIAPHERCVALLTASGLKDPGPIEKALPEPPLVSGGLPELMAALQERLWIRTWLSSASPWTAARRSPTFPARPRRRRRAAPRPCGSPAISILRDPITMAALALGATRRIKIALMAMSPYSVHPVFIAMAAATLDEMYPGRVILCLGAGAPADLKAAGIEATKPLVRRSTRRCRSAARCSPARWPISRARSSRSSGRRLANGGAQCADRARRLARPTC